MKRDFSNKTNEIKEISKLIDSNIPDAKIPVVLNILQDISDANIPIATASDILDFCKEAIRYFSKAC